MSSVIAVVLTEEQPQLKNTIFDDKNLLTGPHEEKSLQ